jgi:hypothetical protein
MEQVSHKSETLIEQPYMAVGRRLRGLAHIQTK